MLAPSHLSLTSPLGTHLPFPEGLLANKFISGEVMDADTIEKKNQNICLFICFEVKHRGESQRSSKVVWGCKVGATPTGPGGKLGFSRVFW